MSIRSELVGLLVIWVCLCLIYQDTQAKPAEDKGAKSKRDSYDFFSSLFGDYLDDDSESEEYLICRNCTVIVAGQGQNNTSVTTAAPATAAPAPVTVAPTPPGDQTTPAAPPAPSTSAPPAEPTMAPAAPAA